MRRPFESLPYALSVLAIASLSTSCRGPETAGNVDPPGPTAEAPKVYSAIGVVRGLPEGSDPQPAVIIQHAPIPDYVNAEGFATGMPSMTMPFGAGETDLEPLEVGGWVEFSFEVRRGEVHPYRLLHIIPTQAPSS